MVWYIYEERLFTFRPPSWPGKHGQGSNPIPDSDWNVVKTTREKDITVKINRWLELYM